MQLAHLGRESHSHAFTGPFRLTDYGLEQSHLLARLADGHGNARCGAVGFVHPRVIWDRINERQRLLVFEMKLHDAAVKGLTDTVGRDETEAADLAAAC